MSSVAPSFRDPGGSVHRLESRVLRFIQCSAMDDFNAFRSSRVCRRLIEQGSVVRSELRTVDDVRRLGGVGLWTEATVSRPAMIVEHERIDFPSYPYEWPAEMLHAAGSLTLSIARQALADALGLKDGTPYNVLFRGSEPVFVDVLSFERRDPLDPVWLAHAQFVRTFLLPLLANKCYNLAVSEVFLTHRDGLEPEVVYELASLRRKISPTFLSLVSIPTWLTRGRDRSDTRLYRARACRSPDKARFVLDHLFGRLERSLKRLEPAQERQSAWSSYIAERSYSEAQMSVKKGFVEDALREVHPAAVLDVGCNSGEFSLLAARHGAEVVAVDSDPVVVGHLWRRSRAVAPRILPLVVDITRPTPAMGWRNNECASFLDRATGAFDTVMMLAVVHHMLVTERVPLPEIIQLAADLTRDSLIIEYVGPDDPMFQVIVRGREHLHGDLTEEAFEAACRSRFVISRKLRIPNSGRALYLLRKLESSPS